MKSIKVDLPDEVSELFGTEENLNRGVRIAIILDLVRRSKISRAKAAELLQMPLAELPKLLAQYEIPWFDYSTEEIEKDLATLGSRLGPQS